MSDTGALEEQERQDEDRDLVVMVVNEDNGREYRFHVGRGITIGKIIERMYKELKVERRTGDRLRCEADGEDVFAFVEMRLRDYLAAGHCPDLVWLFAGEAGGA